MDVAARLSYRIQCNFDGEILMNILYSGFYLRGAISANIQFYSPAVMSAIIK